MKANAGYKRIFWGVWGLLWLLSACSSRWNYDFHPLYQNLRFNDSPQALGLQSTYRTASLYRDYRPVMICDAIFKDERYRAQYLQEMGRGYMLPSNQRPQAQAQESEAFQNQFEFIVFAYAGTTESLKLDQPQALWQLFLKDDDGDVLQPLKVEKLRADTLEVIFLKKYMQELDRWVEVYRVTFPKLSKGQLQQTTGPKPFQLIASSLLGRVTLKWENSDLFY